MDELNSYYYSLNMARAKNTTIENINNTTFYNKMPSDLPIKTFARRQS